LDMITQMRSNDAYFGLPHDVFAFTMIQEIFAVSLGVKLGSYRHVVGSLHLYKVNRTKARSYLREGLQSHVSMPTMPTVDPWPAIHEILRAERALRKGHNGTHLLPTLDPYWADLIRLLQIHRQSKMKSYMSFESIRKQFKSRIYDGYISDLIRVAEVAHK
jgi:thymidylate synthase